MFSFFRKKPEHRQEPDLSVLNTDMHSHLIPGIDDGAQTIDDALLLIRGLADLGYTRLITTPHVMSEIFPNTREIITDGRLRLAESLKQHDVNITLDAAAEYYLDDQFDEWLESGQHLLRVSENLLLVEFSFISAPLNLKDQLFQLRVQGYQPVLAHPERYGYYARNRTVYDEFKDLGCLLQVNLLSFTGYYGKEIQETAFHLADKGLIDLLGTDMHHPRHLHALRNAFSLNTTISKLLDSGKILNPTLP